MRTARLSLLSLVLLAACVLQASRVSVSYTGRDELPPSAATITVDAAGSASTIRGEEMSRQGNTVRSREIMTPTHGTLVVSYVLATSAGEASRGSVSFPLRNDWVWGVDVKIDSLDPARYCFGCAGSKSFPLAAELRRSARDSVWVTWGGNSISNPAIY